MSKPTSEAWIDPWVKHLKKLGVKLSEMDIPWDLIKEILLAILAGIVMYYIMIYGKQILYNYTGASEWENGLPPPKFVSKPVPVSSSK